MLMVFWVCFLSALLAEAEALYPCYLYTGSLKDYLCPPGWHVRLSRDCRPLGGGSEDRL